MLSTALLLAQAAVACQPLPPALTGWNQPARRLAVGAAAELRAANGAAATEVTITRAGRYGVALDQRGWIDVSPLGGSGLTSVAHGHGPACSTVAKIVRFDLKPGRYRIALSKLPKPVARVMLVAD